MLYSGVRDLVAQGRARGRMCFRLFGTAERHLLIFIKDNELDIRLTKPIIDREGLTHPANSIGRPKLDGKSWKTSNESSIW